MNSTPARRESHDAAAVLIRSLLATSVEKEIAAWSPNGARVPVSRGTRERGRRYRFPWAGEQKAHLLTGRSCALELDGHPLTWGRVLRLSDEAVVLEVDIDLPDVAPAGYVVDDSRWLLEALRRELLTERCRPGELLALEMLGYSLRGVGSQRRCTLAPPDGLNRGQQLAVRKAGESGVLFLEGPPGTGKTRTIAAMSEALVKAGLSVLVVAPSNRAADEAASAICERLESAEGFGKGLVLRLGEIRSKGLLHRYGQALQPDAVARNILGEIAREDATLLLRTRERLLKTCPLLVTTAHRAILSKQLWRKRTNVDVVILDEAGMTSLPLAYQVATYATRSVVLAGDPRQLPPVGRSDSAVAQRFFQEDIFHARGVLSRRRSVHGGAAVVTLGVQYRMDEPIQELLNAFVYEGLLTADASVGDRPKLTSPIGDGSLVLLDTALLRAKPSGIRGLANPTHARVIAQYLDRVAGHPLEPESGRSVAILSRFREQSEAIVGELPPLQDRPGVTVRTVHGLQGGEADTVILDLSMAPGSPFPGDYLTDSAIRDVGVRLLTVALSRARRRIVLVADSRLILTSKDIPEDAMSKGILRYFIEKGTSILARLGAEAETSPARLPRSRVPSVLRPAPERGK